LSDDRFDADSTCSDTTDPYKCEALLNQGHWLDSPNRDPDFAPFHNWQVPGCLLHEYTAADIARCSEGGQILFVGDTGTRQVFWATVRRIREQRDYTDNAQGGTDQNRDINISAGGVNLKFMWDPWLNSTMLEQELRLFEKRNGPQLDESDETLPKRPQTSRRTTLIFTGGGLWHARHLGNDGLARFKHDVHKIAVAASSASALENLHPRGVEGTDDQVVFAPVFEPLYDLLSPSRETTIMPSTVEAMNKFIEEQSILGLNVPWSYQDMTKNWPELVGDSGMHVNARVADKMADILLNFRCNAKAAQNQGYPFDKTCCSTYRRVSWVQILAAIGFLPAVSARRVRPTAVDSRLARCGNWAVLATPFAIAMHTIVLAAYYCFLSDRTHVFDKAPKKFANVGFWILLYIAAVLCLPNVKGTASFIAQYDLRSRSRSKHTSSFLPREQSDELKGCMQLYMLVYRYSGASHVLIFDEVFQITIAGYIFLSAYGHTMYFLQKKDYSLQRVMSVLLRLNILPIVLAFVMNRPYASYSFAPLISFWFLVALATIKIDRRYNKSFSFLIGKVMSAAVLATAYIHIKGGLELTSVFLRFVLRIQVDIDQWRSLLGTNKYIPFVGMFVAVLHIHIASVLQTPCDQLPPAGRVFKRNFRVIQAHLVAVSLIVLPGFWILTRRSPDIDDFDWWVPYIAWVPVVALVVLRNSTTLLRSRYSASFAWIGRISLELYLLSNHIWLAGDGSGLLRVGFRGGDGGLFSDRWRDLVILTPILVWLAWKVHDAKRTITNWILEIAQPVPPVGLGIDALDEHGNEKDLFGNGDYLGYTDVEVARTSTVCTGSSLSVTWRLLVIAAGVWLANFVSTL
jgi:hypothetical protein